MRVRVLRAWLAPILIVLVCLAAACGSAAPVVSELTLSASELAAGEEVFARAVVEDEEGDLDRASLRIVLEDSGLETRVSVSEVEPGTTRAYVLVGVTPPRDVAAGRYRLALSAIDNAENESEAVRAPLEIR